MRHTRRRCPPGFARGFTLVELLVVIAIIGALMALLLPAVQSARESGRRITCTSNAGQVAKAFISHDGQLGYLPGWRNTHPALRPVMRTSNPTFAAALDANTPSWPVILMPFLERLDIHKAWMNVTSAQPVPTEAPAMPNFICPTSPADSKSQAQLAYAVNAGTCQVSPPSPRRQYKADGIFVDSVGHPPPGVSGPSVYLAARTTLDAVTGGDGAGNTLLIAEKSSSRITQGSWNAVVPLLSVSTSSLATQPIAIFSSNSPTASPVFGLQQTVPAWAQKIVNSVDGAPNANHPGGVIVGFADGRTQFMRDTVSPHVYAQLVTSDSEWVTSGTSGSYVANSTTAQNWLGLGPKPYTLSAADYE